MKHFLASSRHLFFYHSIFTVLVFMTAGCSARESQKSSPESFMDPHLPASSGPWFEGWYLRITSQNETFGVIAGSYQSSKTSRKEAQTNGLPGYIAFLHGTAAGELKVLESFPLKSRLADGLGQPVKKDPKASTPAAFKWSDELGNHLSNDYVKASFPDGTSFEAAWNQTDPKAPWVLGPGGVLNFFRQFPLHWFVETLSTPAKVLLKSPGNADRVEVGEAHFEKNWGKAFPKSYAWFQGHGKDAHFALAGGVPFDLIGGFDPQAWLAAFVSPKGRWSFSPQTGAVFINTKLDACAGTAQVSLGNLSHQMEFNSQASLSSFSTIHIPTEAGFAPLSDQSFHGTAQVQVFEKGNKKPLESLQFEKVAMEFGGDYKCNPKMRK